MNLRIIEEFFKKRAVVLIEFYERKLRNVPENFWIKKSLKWT